MLSVGSKAPAWSGKDQDGKERASSEYVGQWLLLYFYPKDDTPGCTLEACGFRDNYAGLAPHVAVVGVSADDSESHNEFSKKYQLPFTLIADVDRSIILAFGADGQTFSKRVTFLIDPKGVIQKIYHGFDCEKHAESIREDLTILGVIAW